MRARPSRLAGVALALAAGTVLSACSSEPAVVGDGIIDDAISAPGSPTPDPAVDWKTLAYAEADCYSRENWIADGLMAEAWDAIRVDAQAADVTGDGKADTLVPLTCPAPTSSRPVNVVVFDGVGNEPLGVLDGDLFFAQAAVTVDGNSVILEGPTVAGDDPYCCAGHHGRAVYRWTDSRFVLTSQTEVLSTQPVSREALDDGTHVGVVRAVVEGRVFLDVVDWLEGDAALQACREDGVPVYEGETAWCNDYYIRNDDDLVRALPVADGAPLTYLDIYRGQELQLSDVAGLERVGKVSDRPDTESYFRFTVDGGVVTAMTELFVP